MELSDALYQLAASSWKISLKRQFELIYLVLTDHFKLDHDTVNQQLTADYHRNKLKGSPVFQRLDNNMKTQRTGIANKRQQLHQNH